MKRQRGLSTAWAIVIAAGLFVGAGVAIWCVEYRRGQRALEALDAAIGEAFPQASAADQAAAVRMAAKMLRRWHVSLAGDATAEEAGGIWVVVGNGSKREGRVVSARVVMRAVRHAGGRRWQLEACDLDGERVYPQAW